MTGKEMRKLRRDLDYSQTKFGEIVGYAKDYISHLERTDAVLSSKLVKLIEANMGKFLKKQEK